MYEGKKPEEDQSCVVLKELDKIPEQKDDDPNLFR
jgi:hypothetical protein